MSQLLIAVQPLLQLHRPTWKWQSKLQLIQVKTLSPYVSLLLSFQSAGFISLQITSPARVIIGDISPLDVHVHYAHVPLADILEDEVGLVPSCQWPVPCTQDHSNPTIQHTCPSQWSWHWWGRMYKFGNWAWMKTMALITQSDQLMPRMQRWKVLRHLSCLEQKLQVLLP